jgi:hypothetical protein
MTRAEAEAKLHDFLRDECLRDEDGWTADARTRELLELLAAMGVTWPEDEDED